MAGSFTEALTIGITLTLVFGALCFYLYSRLVQSEKRVSLIEQILLDVKMSMEMMGSASGPAPWDSSDESPNMSVNHVQPVSAPEPLNTEDVDSADDEGYYKDVLSQVGASTAPATRAVDLSGASSGPTTTVSQKVNVNYESMTVKELKDLVKKRGLKLPSGAGRKELTEALKKQDVPTPTEPIGAPPATEGALLEEPVESESL
jgi:hypothetical protein